MTKGERERRRKSHRGTMPRESGNDSTSGVGGEEGGLLKGEREHRWEI